MGGGGGWAEYWVIKIFGATESAVSGKPCWGVYVGGGVSGHATPLSINILKVILAPKSVTSYPMNTVHAQNI